MTLLDPRLWLAAALALAAAYGAGRFQQWRADEREAIAARAELVEKARQTEQNLRDDMGVLEDVKNAEIRRVAAQRDAAVRELRNRPERMPEAARPACAGATGAELSGRDAEFLTGLAARADELRAELGACQRRERATFDALTGGH